MRITLIFCTIRHFTSRNVSERLCDICSDDIKFLVWSVHFIFILWLSSQLPEKVQIFYIFWLFQAKTAFSDWLLHAALHCLLVRMRWQVLSSCAHLQLRTLPTETPPLPHTHTPPTPPSIWGSLSPLPSSLLVIDGLLALSLSPPLNS